MDEISDEELLEIAIKHDIELVTQRSNWFFIGGVASALLIIGVLYFIFGRRMLRKPASTRTVEDWRGIISKGESNRIEFKSSLRWDLKEQKANKALEFVIVKTITAFLNTEGGILFIGVDDEGNILGLENDYEVLHKKNSDGFLLVLTNLINKHLGRNAHGLVHANIISIDGRDLCVLEIAKSNQPVFLKKGEKEEFFIRTSAASVPLSMREAAEYIRSHWSK